MLVGMALVFCFIVGLVIGLVISALHLGLIGTTVAIVFAICGIMWFFESLERRRI